MSDNQIQSRARLNSLFRRMTAMVQGSYKNIIEEQLAMGITEKDTWKTDWKGDVLHASQVSSEGKCNMYQGENGVQC